MSSRKVNSPKPKWWQLYATFPLLMVLFVLEHRLSLSAGGHQAVQIGIVLVIFGLIYLWLRANSEALLNEDREQDRGKIVVIEFHSSPPPGDGAEASISHPPMFQLPVSGLRNTLDDTFELEPVKRVPTDPSLN